MDIDRIGQFDRDDKLAAPMGNRSRSVETEFRGYHRGSSLERNLGMG